MPYIEKKDRPKFGLHIKEVVDFISGGEFPQFVKADYFGYYVNRLIRGFIGTAHDGEAFNSATFDKDKKATLRNSADSIVVAIGRSDPIGAAGGLNYSITAPLWGLMGEKKSVETASYGYRALLHGTIEEIRDKLPQSHNQSGTSNADIAKSYRRYLIAKAVLSHVLKETYRRLDSDYEDTKWVENGDIWPLVVAIKKGGK